VLDVDVERLLEARLAAAAQYPDSLDRPLSAGEDDSSSVQERVGIADRDLTEMEDGASLEMLTSGLGDRDRELLRLRFEEDLTQSDIAERVGLSQMHVSRLLRDALTKLGDELGEPDALEPAA
jgi:RNA polymerase sigma-B factor